jgi:hypothetical protein
MSAAAEVVGAVIARLSANTELLARLGGERVYDRLPAGTRPPYVVLEAARTIDWSTATEAGDDHRLIFSVAAQGTGRAIAAVIAASVVAALVDTAPPALASHRIVRIAHEQTEITSRDSESWRAIVRLRIITERLS